jgi:hypothetical protein
MKIVLPEEVERRFTLTILTQVRDFGHKIHDFGRFTERKSFGDGSGLAGMRCSEDLLC